MTPETFISKWRGVELSERAASQDHFNELCELLEIKKPTDDDPTGERFAFEKPVPRGGKGGGPGFADVWRKGSFVWEYKRKGKYTTLAAAIPARMKCGHFVWVHRSKIARATLHRPLSRLSLSQGLLLVPFRRRQMH